VSRLVTPLATLVLALALALPSVACGGAVCGDGVAEGGEACDDGNNRDDDRCSNSCKVQQSRSAQIIWTMVAQNVPGFSETCTGVSASKIKLEITGAQPMDLDIDCNYSQYMLNDLEPGDYAVKATLFSASGQALTKGQSMASFTIAQVPSGTPVQATINFPFGDFVRTDYVGDWFYGISWAGAASCSTAIPAVTQTSLRLERDGQPIISATGVTIDGLTPTACFEGEHAPAINKLPWGPAELTIVGLDASGTPQFRESFPTFIGAGITNPSLAYDVNSLAPDAGVPDAGVADAAVSDAPAAPDVP